MPTESGFVAKISARDAAEEEAMSAAFPAEIGWLFGLGCIVGVAACVVLWVAISFGAVRD